MNVKKQYNISNDFKLQVVQMVLDGVPISQVAKEHSLTKSTVYTWVATYKRAGSFNDPPSKVEMVAELIRLRDENKRLTQENNILRGHRLA